MEERHDQGAMTEFINNMISFLQSSTHDSVEYFRLWEPSQIQTFLLFKLNGANQTLRAFTFCLRVDLGSLSPGA